MSSVHSSGTRPEIKVRRYLHSHGFRYNVNVKRLPGTPDIVLPRYRTVIFVNGCFWHGHKGCPKFVMPKTRVDFWTNKITHNQERDILNNQRLESLAWNVIVIWECELAKAAFSETMDRVEAQIKANEASWQAYKARRKQDRQFALEQARKRREIIAQVEAELSAQFHTPVRIGRGMKVEEEG